MTHALKGFCQGSTHRVPADDLVQHAKNRVQLRLLPPYGNAPEP
jgi:hypothetical protein